LFCSDQSGSPALPFADWELRQGDMDKIKQTADKIIAAME